MPIYFDLTSENVGPPCGAYPKADPGCLDEAKKNDEGKPKPLKGCLHQFPLALQEVAKLSEKGARKYSWDGWEDVENGEQRYGEALVRHLLVEAREEVDSETGVNHMVCVAWNALARLELTLRNKEFIKK